MDAAVKLTHPDIIVVKNKIESGFFRFYWLIVLGIFLLRALVQYIDTRTLPYSLVDPSRILMELGLLLSIFCCNSLFSELPYKLKQIFSTSAFHGRKKEHFSEAFFYKQLTARLNSNIRCFIGALTVLLMSIYYGSTYDINTAIGGSIWGFLEQMLAVPPIIVYSYFIGILAWKYLVISHALYRLPDNFHFKVQFWHPDKAGGLLSIGLLGLKLIYVPVIPTVISACELLLAYIGLIQLTKSNYVFLLALLVYGLVGSFIGLLPIFKFHRVMQSQQSTGITMLNQLANRILKLKEEIFKSFETLEEGSVESIRSDIAAYETIYNAHQNINTWPINRKVLVEIWGTQTFVAGQLLATWNLISQFS